MNDVSRSEHPILYSLLWRFFIYDYFVTIIQMLFSFMGKHALKRFDFEISANRLDVSRDHLVSILWLNSPCCSLESSPGSHKNVSLFAFSLSSNDKAMGARCWETINMGPDFNFNQVFQFQL